MSNQREQEGYGFDRRYSDWVQVYRSEVIDKARHWPVCNKRDNEVSESIINGANNE